MPDDKPTITIVGAGLAGALMACYLGKDGYRVALYEKRPDPRGGNVDAGRSINLALSTRGISALAEVGVAERVLAEAVAMPGRMMHSLAGELTYQPYGTAAGQVINSVSRGGLNCLLLDAAEAHDTVTLHFDSQCVDADLDRATAMMQNADGLVEEVHGDLLIASDGAFSAVRKRMQRRDRFDYSQSYLSHGYKELCIPPAEGGGFRMERNALHIWPRGGTMMIALPNADGSYTVTCFWPLDGPGSFAALQTDDDIRNYFNRVFPDAVPHMPTLVEDYRGNPTSSLVTVRCGPWNHHDKVVLLGDAAHAVVPFYGQGMNASFEDCAELNRCLQEFAPDYARALQVYYERRKPNTDALADLAIGNFYEMRDHVASKWFLLKKKAGRALHRIMPGTFIPIYSMVTFSNMPYAEAVDRAARQGRAIRTTLGVLGFALVVAVSLW